jgi:hypothetical protein
MRLLILFSLLVFGAAFADTLSDRFRVCGPIPDPTLRLRCFDVLYDEIERAKGAVEPSTAAAPPQTAHSITTPEPVREPEVTDSDFGREHHAAVQRSGDRLEATLANVEHAGYGQLRVTLDNGQVWEQIGTERYVLADGDRVVIERGTFNSFFLRKASSSRKVRFTRLR